MLLGLGFQRGVDLVEPGRVPPGCRGRLALAALAVALAVTVAVPAAEEAPTVLDMATTVAAYGR